MAKTPSRCRESCFTSSPCYLLPFVFYFFFFSRLHCIAHRTLVSQQAMELGSSAVKVRHPNHWTAKEFPLLLLKMLLRKDIGLIGWYPITSPDGFWIDWLNQKASSCHHLSAFWLRSSVVWGLPEWFNGKESSCQCRRCKSCRFDPWFSKVPWSRKCNPLQYSCLENPVDREAW